MFWNRSLRTNEAVTPAPERHWWALLTRHQHEKCVARSLEAKGFETYLPLYRSTRRWRDRSKQLLLPLFPCYAFVRVGLECRLDVLTTPGCLQIVGWSGRAAVIPQGEIDAVRQVLTSELDVGPHPFVPSGERVRVVDGPLAGLEGILIRPKGAARLVISVQALGRSAAVEVSVTHVVPLVRPRTVLPVAANGAA